MRLGEDKRGRMRSRLQYIYSISVFLGVLTAAYLLMDRESAQRRPADSLQAGAVLRYDAGVGDEALLRLIEVEKQLTTIRENSDLGRKTKLKFGKPFHARP